MARSGGSTRSIIVEDKWENLEYQGFSIASRQHANCIFPLNDYTLDRFILMLFNFKIAFVQLLQGIFQSTMKNVNILHCFPFIVNWRQSFPSNTVLLGLWKRDWNLTHALFTPGCHVLICYLRCIIPESHVSRREAKRNSGSGYEIDSITMILYLIILWPRLFGVENENTLPSSAISAKVINMFWCLLHAALILVIYL